MTLCRLLVHSATTLLPVAMRTVDPFLLLPLQQFIRTRTIPAQLTPRPHSVSATELTAEAAAAAAAEKEQKTIGRLVRLQICLTVHSGRISRTGVDGRVLRIVCSGAMSSGASASAAGLMAAAVVADAVGVVAVGAGGGAEEAIHSTATATIRIARGRTLRARSPPGAAT
jgi:hypothetical protein